MIHILTDGILGALSFLLGFWVAGRFANRESQPTRYLIILVLVGVVGAALARDLVTPHILAWNSRDEVQQFLDSDPLFQRILTDHPALREPMEQALAAGMQSGGRQQAVAAARGLIEQVFPAYLAKASDDGLRDYATTTVAVLKKFQAKDPLRCFQFLHPGVAGAATPTDEEGRRDLYDLMVRLVTNAPDVPPSEQAEDAADLLEGVTATLAERYGDGLQALATPEAPDVDRAQVCAMTIDLYAEILTLPDEDAARVLRSMFAQ